MKAPVLGLSIAAAAFAGSSIYLWQQLQLERERGAQVAETTRQLKARLAELDTMRQQFAHVRSGDGAVVSGVFGSGPAPAATATPARGVTEAARVESGQVVELPAGRPPAMDKMLRWQLRADNKRMYADAGAALGISKEKTSKLIDLLTEQQIGDFGSDGESPWTNDPVEARRRFEERQRASNAAIEELIGPEKMQALQEYQQSLPARQEFEMLVRQLEGNDVTLTPEQSRKLLAAYLEERKRVPAPTFGRDFAQDPTIYQQAYADWQADYSNRLTGEARNILDSTQLAAFNEVQEMQREMRSQFRAVTFSSSQGGAIALQGGAVAVATPITVAEPAPADERKP
jgi:hypothetical protein